MWRSGWCRAVQENRPNTEGAHGEYAGGVLAPFSGGWFEGAGAGRRVAQSGVDGGDRLADQADGKVVAKRRELPARVAAFQEDRQHGLAGRAHDQSSDMLVGQVGRVDAINEPDSVS